MLRQRRSVHAMKFAHCLHTFYSKTRLTMHFCARYWNSDTGGFYGGNTSFPVESGFAELQARWFQVCGNRMTLLHASESCTCNHACESGRLLKGLSHDCSRGPSSRYFAALHGCTATAARRKRQTLFRSNSSATQPGQLGVLSNPGCSGTKHTWRSKQRSACVSPCCLI
jgi:hypothetical protein